MQVAVLAFGHIHFKAACEAQGVDWRTARHISNMGVFKQLDAATTRLIVHSSAHDHRQRCLLAEAKRLGFAF